MLRAVLDTNVLVAALISPDGPPAAVLKACADGEYDLVVCPRLLAELRAVLGRDRIRRYVRADEAEMFASWLERMAVGAPDPTDIPAVSPDADDDYLFALARGSRVHALVSGDAHLLGLRLAQQRILSPAAFEALLDRLR